MLIVSRIQRLLSNTCSILPKYYYQRLRNCSTSTNKNKHLPDPNGVIRSEFPEVPVQSVPFTDTLQDAIWRHSIEQPGRAAFISAENPLDRLSFSDFLLSVHSVASFLHSIGFKRGDVAGVVTPNCWHFLAAFMSAALRRGCISGVNALFTEVEIARLFNDSNCKVAFCTDAILDKMMAVMCLCPQLKHLILLPSQFPAKQLSNLPPGVLHWKDIVLNRPDLSRELPKIDVERDLMYLPYSSGTTGPPKGVMLTHKNVGTMARIFNSHLDHQILKRMDPDWDWKSEHNLLILPLYHIYGFVLGLNCLLSGGTGIIFKRFDLDRFCRTVQDYKVKVAMLVPPILVLLSKSQSVISRYDLSSLRVLMTGAAPAGHDLLEEVKRRLPSVEHICQGYGMTEQSMCSHLPVFGMLNPNAAGRLISNFEMKIVCTETGRPVEAGQPGEICTRSPTTMLGYLNCPKATMETVDKDGWLRTGDIGYFDDKGWTYVVERLKELIKVNGLQVAPAELEDLILSHPHVQDCAVIGVPDERSGELPKAFVVKANEALTERELVEFVRTKVAPFKHIKSVEFVKEISKSPSGKILRRVLREKQAKR